LLLKDPRVDTAAGWSRCLALAWDSFCAGTTPVGAVVLAPDGRIAAEDRGRRFEPPVVDRQLAHSRIPRRTADTRVAA
jgi:hypothetical protein